MRKKGSIKGYIATRTPNGPPGGAFIYCTDGEWWPERVVGPGGFCAKVYKTIGGLKRAGLGNVNAKWIEE